MILERILAALVLVACALLLVRLMLGPRRRARLDAGLRSFAYATRRRATALRRWRSTRREAARVADEAIRRARGRGEWDGNVYTPKATRKPPRDKMH
jgi:hypothetical protein